MSTPVTIRVRQQGYVRTAGYQATQWAVTVPVVDPVGTPPLATDPLSYAPLFVIRNTLGFETLERVATLLDFENVPVAELEYLDMKGPEGGAFFAAVVVGDTLRITTSIGYWLQEQAPYTDQDFIITQIASRVQGSSASCIQGTSLQLGDYQLTDADIGRWVLLSGFTEPTSNGYAQIVGYVGNTAKMSKAFLTSETGGTWNFPWVKIQSSFPGLEPRYFPTREKNLAWDHLRGGDIVTQGTRGETARANTAALSRSVRSTMVAPTLQSALNLFTVSRAAIADLQRQAAANNEEFTVLITYTVGP